MISAYPEDQLSQPLSKDLKKDSDFQSIVTPNFKDKKLQISEISEGVVNYQQLIEDKEPLNPDAYKIFSKHKRSVIEEMHNQAPLLDHPDFKTLMERTSLNEFKLPEIQ